MTYKPIFTYINIRIFDDHFAIFAIEIILCVIQKQERHSSTIVNEYVGRYRINKILNVVKQSELQIWSLQNLGFPWNSSSYLQAYFGLWKQRVLTMLSRLVMLKKSQHAVRSWNSLQIWSSLWWISKRTFYSSKIFCCSFLFGKDSSDETLFPNTSLI